MKVAAETVKVAGGWQWYTFEMSTERLLIWDTTVYPTEKAAVDDSLRLHQQWQREGAILPYSMERRA